MKYMNISLFVLFSLFPALSASAQTQQLFHTADRCISCHNGLITKQGEDISIGVDWRSSMMAHSARDPYWQASVKRETLVHPSAADAIQHECTACHMPMSRYLAKIAGNKAKAFAHLPVVLAQEQRSLLAADGVSCSMCHQIKEDKLGTKESFTAGFVVDTEKSMGQREVFGPYEIDDGRKALMKSSSEFIPHQAMHTQGSELCASCHTLYTHALNEKGEVIGELPEQVPYLEWKHSDYYNVQSCQTCHMPAVDGQTHISGVIGQDREDVSRHVFRGGNFFMPKIFNHYRDILGVTAQPQELDTTSLRTAEHLQSSSAEIVLQNADIQDNRLHVKAAVSNLAGHKLPSAYPSRRVWLHLAVYDGSRQQIFESGRLNPDGSIEGNDNDADPDCFEPHYSEIDSPDKVQIYEGILAAAENKVTTVLLSAVRYIKDNRLPPKGFDKGTAQDDIAVQGAAFEDSDFTGGGDTVLYRISVEGREGPFTIEAALWYQPIAYRWAHNLQQQTAEKIDRFLSYYNNFSRLSGIVLARDQIEVK
jgi:hypothetical protein